MKELIVDAVTDSDDEFDDGNDEDGGERYVEHALADVDLKFC